MNQIIQPCGMLFAFKEAEEQQEPEIPTLTRREVDIVTAFAKGNKQIAHDLLISEKPVRKSVSNIYKNPHVYDR